MKMGTEHLECVPVAHPSFLEDDCTEALTSKVPHLEPGPLKRYFRLK